MDRREMLGVLGAATAGLAVTTAGREARAQHDDKDDIHRRCAEACTNCERACNHGFHHCYQQVEMGKKEHAKSMHILVDCGDICGTAGKLVARMSPLMVHTCQACAECCEDTIETVEKLHDSAMNGTLESLRSCAKTCREMVQKMGGHKHAAKTT